MTKLKSILLVDDDDAANFLHELLIEEADITQEVKVAKNGLEALELLERDWHLNKTCPDLIFLDLNMPVMNGFEFLEAYESLVYTINKPIVIVMLTSSQNPTDIKKSQNQPIQGFLNKPLTQDTLAKLVDSHFNS